MPRSSASFAAFALLLNGACVAVVGCSSGPDAGSPSSGAAGTGSTSAGVGGQAISSGGQVTSSAGMGGASSSGSSAGGTGPGSGGAPSGSGGTNAGAAGSAAGGAAAGSGGSGGMGGSGGGFPDPKSFVCNEFVGVSVTGDWFGAGFENGVDGARFQARTATHAFVELWADPNNAIWSTPLVSNCTTSSATPDRVLLVAVNWDYKTEGEWETTLTKVVQTIQGRYKSLRELDLLTMLRAPNNQVCGNPGSVEQVVAPYIDQAMVAVAAKYPNLVRVAPPFYAPSCDVFLPNSPHYATGGAEAVAKVMSAYYATH